MQNWGGERSETMVTVTTTRKESTTRVQRAEERAASQHTRNGAGNKSLHSKLYLSNKSSSDSSSF